MSFDGSKQVFKLTYLVKKHSKYLKSKKVLLSVKKVAQNYRWARDFLPAITFLDVSRHAERFDAM